MRTGWDSPQGLYVGYRKGLVSLLQGDVIVTTNHARLPTASFYHLRSSQSTPVRSMLIRAMVLSGAAVGLAGCASNNALLGDSQAQPATNLAATAVPATPAPAAPVVLTKVAIAPVIGAPDQVARQLQQEFSAAVGKQKATVVAAGQPADYTLRGYIVAAKDRTGTKISYIWDVTDPAQKRVNRITGEEVIPGQTPKDPWSAVTPQMTQSIAQKAATSFGAWLPQAATAPAALPVASAAGAAPVQTASAPAAGAPLSSPRVASATPAPQQAAFNASEMTAIVPSVVGAPGDGATALTRAIQGELGKNGVNLSQQPTASSYRVEGVVKMGQSRDGKQPIQIDWNVKDPQGKKLGTVSQKNEIPEGSLDGAWGQTADAAAAAAAQGILKLLPQKQ